MNDLELDELLDRWQAPPMRESLRDDLRVAYATHAAPRPPRRGFHLPKLRLGRLVAATVGAAAILFTLVQLAPRTVALAFSEFRIPYYVVYDYERLDAKGSTPPRSRFTAFPYGGIDINMSVVDLYGTPLDAFRELAASIRNRMVLAAPSIVLPKHPPMTEPAWHVEYVKSGCSTRPTVIGHETIAGYHTVIVQNAFAAHRFTYWFAPELGCAALKHTFEQAQPDGTYKMVSRKEAVKVTIVDH